MDQNVSHMLWLPKTLVPHPRRTTFKNMVDINYFLDTYMFKNYKNNLTYHVTSCQSLLKPSLTMVIIHCIM